MAGVHHLPRVYLLLYRSTRAAAIRFGVVRYHSESGTPELLYPHTKFPSESCIPVHNSLLDPVRGYNIRVVD